MRHQGGMRCLQTHDAFPLRPLGPGGESALSAPSESARTQRRRLLSALGDLAAAHLRASRAERLGPAERSRLSAGARPLRGLMNELLLADVWPDDEGVTARCLDLVERAGRALVDVEAEGGFVRLQALTLRVQWEVRRLYLLPEQESAPRERIGNE